MAAVLGLRGLTHSWPGERDGVRAGTVDVVDGSEGCLLCDPAAADAAFDRARIWDRDGWRLSMVLRGPVAGFAHLEPVRHIPSIAELDGPEAHSFGPALAAASALLRDATGAERTYSYLFGERVAHLHVNLAPHRRGGPLRGGAALVDPDAPPLAGSVHHAALTAVRGLVARTPGFGEPADPGVQ